jgi:hypothetical protein
MIGHELNLKNIEVKVIKRFLSKIKLGRCDECDIWTAGVDSDKYGLFSWKGRILKSSRFAYALFNDTIIPVGMLIRHTCDNPRCVRKEHLLLGSYLDNLRDAIERNRRPRQDGENNRGAKLTDIQVIEIHRLWLLNKYTYKEIGEMVGGVGKTTIYYIVHGGWSHLHLNFDPFLRDKRIK